MDRVDVVRRHIGDAGADVLSIIRDLGIRYVEQPLPAGQSGSISFDGQSYVITVDAHEAPQRKRFTAAHELAHYLMHRDMLANGQNLHRDNLFGDAARWNDAAPFSPQHEVEANRFAAEMLMPRAQVRRWHSEFRGNVSELARKFNVSQAAMKIRLKNLGLPTA